MIDLFSKQAAEYAKYRPKYPKELYDFIFNHVKHFDCAWDCGTGNGQAAVALAKKFTKVFATDLSKAQIQQAEQHLNITYDVCKAEKTPFPSHSFDLVTVAQALHWFEFDEFYSELHRVLKPHGIFAAWSYGLARVDPKVDQVVDYLYDELTGPYWNPRRRYIDEKYETIPFPLKKIECPPFTIELKWTLDQYENYFAKTWSAVGTYIEKEGSNPVDLIKADLKSSWGDPIQHKKVTWPVYLLMGNF